MMPPKIQTAQSFLRTSGQSRTYYGPRSWEQGYVPRLGIHFMFRCPALVPVAAASVAAAGHVVAVAVAA